MEVWQKRVSHDSSDVENVRNLALAQNNFGMVVAQDGRPAEAIGLLMKARDAQTKTLAAEPDSREFSADLAATLGNLGLVLSQTGDKDAAVQEFNEAIRIGRQLADESNADENVLRSLAATYNSLGLLQDISKPAAAAEAYQKAIAIQLKLVKLDPINRVYQSDLARTYSNLGYLSSRTKDWQKAELSYGDAIHIQQNLVKSAPMTWVYRHDLAISYNNLGMAQSRGGKWSDATESFQNSAQLQDALLIAQPADSETRSNLGSVWNNMGMLFDRQRRYADAEKGYQQAIANQRRALDGASTNERYRALLSQHFMNAARNYNSQAKYDAAVQVALQRKGLWPGKADRLYSVAQQLATTYGMMRTANVSEQSQASCVRAALVTLRESIAAGLPIERLKDPSLASLAGSDDFRKLLDETTASLGTPSPTQQTKLSRTN
jgi:tetratricopeptide (TPR) repeat protein